MESVDPDALAELERRAQAADGVDVPVSASRGPASALSAKAQAEQPPSTPEPFPPRAPHPAPTPDPTLTPVWKVGADGKLEALVEAAAVEKKLATFEATLFRMQAQLQHTMLLVMTLADHGRITPEDYDRALAQMRQAEQGRR